MVVHIEICLITKYIRTVPFLFKIYNRRRLCYICRDNSTYPLPRDRTASLDLSLRIESLGAGQNPPKIPSCQDVLVFLHIYADRKSGRADEMVLGRAYMGGGRAGRRQCGLPVERESSRAGMPASSEHAGGRADKLTNG